MQQRTHWFYAALGLLECSVQLHGMKKAAWDMHNNITAEVEVAMESHDLNIDAGWHNYILLHEFLL